MNEHVNYFYKVAQILSYQVFKSFETNTAAILTKLLKTYIHPDLSAIPKFEPSISKKRLTKLILYKEVLPFLFVIVVPFPTMIGLLNLG